MGMLTQILGGVIASRMGGGLGGGLGGLARGGVAGGGLGKAMLIMLAAKAAHDYMRRRHAAGPGPAAAPATGLGGMLARAGEVGGLGALIEQFKRNGYGDTIESWIKPGLNKHLAPEELADALGHDTVDDLAEEAGMPKKQLLEELSETLPDTVDQLTPGGRIPPASTI